MSEKSDIQTEINSSADKDCQTDHAGILQSFAEAMDRVKDMGRLHDFWVLLEEIGTGTFNNNIAEYNMADFQQTQSHSSSAKMFNIISQEVFDS